jgi:hypothetical protein
MTRISAAIFLPALFLASLPAIAASPVAGQLSTLTAENSGECMNDSGDSLKAGNPIIQSPCNGGKNQDWTLTAVGTNKYQVINKASGLCLDVFGYSTVNGAKIDQYTCMGTSHLNQIWSLQPSSGGGYTLVSANSGKCLDVPGSSTSNGVQLVQQPCNGATNQSWVFNLVGSPTPAPTPTPTPTPVPPATGQIPTGWPTEFVIGTAVWTDSSQFAYLTAFGQPKWGAVYQYLSGGINSGWQTWGIGFVSNYLKMARAANMLPVFTYYMIVGSPPQPADGSPQTDLNTPSTMLAYFADFTQLMKQIAAVGSSPVVVHVEPDMWGYLEQDNDNPAALPASVASSGNKDVAAYPNTVAGFGQALIHLRNLYAPNVILAANVSVWAWNTSTNCSLSVTSIAAKDVAFMTGIGDWDMYFTDIAYGDAGAPRGTWWDEKNVTCPNFNVLVNWATAFTTGAKKPLVLWQTPVGNTVFDTCNNTAWHYQDNRAQYWLQNYPSDGHLSALANAGVIGILFTGGEGDPTDIYNAAGDGITNPVPTNGNIAVSTVPDDDGGALRAWTLEYYENPLALK